MNGTNYTGQIFNTPTPFLVENSSLARFGCDLAKNPWCGQFGTQQIFEVIYLTILTIFGIFGNLLVIFSIVLEKKAHKNANIFIINLAIADFVVSWKISFLIRF